MKAIVALALVAVTGFGAQDFKREAPRDKKDPLEGKAPPALTVTNWTGAKAEDMTWAKLKGKVVVIDFWGTW